MWINWIPEQAHGIHQQLLKEAGKHAGVIWLLNPPPYVAASMGAVTLADVQHFINEGAVPIGYVDLEGNIHSFHINPPFDPPNFKVVTVEGISLTYENFSLNKDWVANVYDHICMENMDALKKGHDAVEKGKHDA